MKLTIVSYFAKTRDNYQRYFYQMRHLAQLLDDNGHELFLVIGYHQERLKDLLGEHLVVLDGELVNVNHGGRIYGSVVDVTRFKQLAYIGNTLWKHIPKHTDVIALVESDLVWEPATLNTLFLDAIAEKSVVAPLVKQGKKFYDTWAFRADGANFEADEPYHPCLYNGERYVRMESVGSVLFMPYELGKNLTWPEEDVVVGFCEQVTKKRRRVLLDTELEVQHP